VDKYEYRVKAEQIVKLVGRKNYIEAMKIADEIDWNRVKNVQMLCTVSDIYAKNERYEESREILYLAVDRSPGDRVILYNIVELSLLLGDMKEAVNYFREYSQSAPNDSSIYILKYKLYAANSNTNLETLISILEELKELEFHEDWGFELARLYAEGGYIEQCVELCDELDLWFNEGPFVLQALELKQEFAELTPSQQSKLEQGYAMINEAEQMQRMFVQEEQPPMQGEFGVEEQVPMPETNAMEKQMPEAYAMEEQMPMPEAYAMGEQIPMPEEAYATEEQMPMPEAYAMEEQIPMPEAYAMEEQIPMPEAYAMEEPMPTSEAYATKEPMSMPEKEEDIFFAGRTAEAISKEIKVGAVTTPDGITKISSNKKKEQEKEPETWVMPDRSIVIEEGDANGSLELIENIGETGISGITESEDNDIEEETKKVKSEKKHRSGSIFSTIGRLGKMLVEPAADYDMEEDESDEINDGELEEEIKNEVPHAIQEPQVKKFVNSGRFNLDDIAAAQEAYEETSNTDKVSQDDNVDNKVVKISPEKEHITRDTKPFDKVAFKEKKNLQLYEENMEGALKNIDKVVDGGMKSSKVEEVLDKDETAPVWNGVSRYDTMNLQRELAKSIQKLLEATEKDDVDSTLENVKRLVEDSNIPELTETMRFRTVRSSMLNNWAKKQAENLSAKPEIEESVRIGSENYVREEPVYNYYEPTSRKPEVEVIQSLKLKPTKQDRKRELEQILTLENDGQIGLIMPEEEVVEKQITGQLNIQDVLLEFERQKSSEITEKEKRELEKARNKALNETQEFMSQVMDLLNQCLPKCGDDDARSTALHNRLKKVQKELNSTNDLSQISELNAELADTLEKVCPVKSSDTDEEVSKAQLEENNENEVSEPQLEEVFEDNFEYAFTEDELESEMSEDSESEMSGESELEMSRDSESEMSEDSESEMLEDLESEMLEDSELEMSRESEELTNDDIGRMLEQVSSDLANDVQNSIKENTGNSIEDNEDAKIESMLEGIRENNDSEQLEKEAVKGVGTAAIDVAIKQSAASLSGLAESMNNSNLDKKQKLALSYFANIPGVATQVDKLLNVDKKGNENMIITGPDGSGKTSLALRIIKAQQDEENQKLVVAKIKGASLNSQDMDEVFEKVNGGVLVVEKAAALSDTTMKKISEKLDNGEKIQIILAAKKKSVERLIGRNPEFMKRFKVSIDLPNYNNDELVEYGKTYAKANGYNIEDMAVLALFSRLGAMHTDSGYPNFNDVKTVIDEAIRHAERRKKKIIKRLFGKKSDDSTAYLLEEDFA